MRYLLVIAIMLIGFASCNKTSEPTVTRQDDLRSGKWKMIAGTIRWDPAIGADTIIHYYDSLKVCEKDDYLQFKEGIEGIQNSGQKCDESTPDEVGFHWYLENNGKIINIYNAYQTFLHREAISAPFTSYSPTQFTIRFQDFVPNFTTPSLNDTLTSTYTFQKF